jgi:hypothetical protein
LAVKPAAWRRAYQFALANAMIFLVLSWTQFALKPTSLTPVILAPGLFFLGATIAFQMLLRSGGAFAALAWFVLGAGIYFGLGTVLGGVAPDFRSMQYGSEAVLLGDILRVNILNSSSVAVVLASAMPLAYHARVTRTGLAFSQHDIDGLLRKVFPALAGLALAALGLQFIYFPTASNLLVRTFLSSASMTVPFCLLILGMLRSRLGLRVVSLGCLVLLLAVSLSLLTMSKTAIMSNVLPLVAGFWVYQRKLWSITAGLIITIVIYAYAGALANDGRQHPDYDAATNSPLTRLGIVVDTIVGDTRGERTATSGPRAELDVPSTVIRLSLTDIQAYLMDQYDSRQRGTSLDDFWVALIPRALWPDKPIVTRFGGELHEEFWATANADSALAPSYSAEAYWNYGPLGVLIVSLLIGAEVGWMTHRWHVAVDGHDLAFFVIAFPSALWGAFVESWIAATYIGGFLLLVVLWCAARLIIHGLLGTAPKHADRAMRGLAIDSSVG